MRDSIRQALQATNGRIFTVGFRKKDGSYRKLNGRVRVRGKKGGVNSLRDFPQYQIVYDVVQKDFRAVNLDTVDYLAADGQRFRR